MEGLPTYIRQVIHQLECGFPVEESLMKLAPHISHETSLYNVFAQLEFDVETR
jgi:hypothetical protein